MKMKSLLKPVGWGKNRAKTIIGFDAHFGKEGQVHKLREAFHKMRHPEYLTETFEEAMARQKMKETDIKDAYTYQRNMFRLWFGLGIGAVLAGIYSIVKGEYLVCMPAVAFLMIATSTCYQASYRCYSINKRKLGVVSSWKKSGEWFPKPFKAKSQSKSMVQS